MKTPLDYRHLTAMIAVIVLDAFGWAALWCLVCLIASLRSRG